ncbi:MAG: roadblock/LC7 domain-containing protein [Verrucomicrobiota bacterium]
MFTKFKKLFRKDIDTVLATSIPAAQNHTVTGSVSPYAAAPVSFVPPTAVLAPMVQVAEPVKSGDMVSLSLKSILGRLPSSLASAVQTQGTGFVSLPTSKILQELPKGAVKISFGELRRASPVGAFLDNPRHDQMLIELPLNEILARLPLTLLTRRTDQKQVCIPDEVTNVFGPRGQGASTATFKPKPIAASTLFAPDKATGVPITIPAISAPLRVPPAEPHLEVMPPAPEAAEMNDVLEVGLLALSESWPENVRQEIRTSSLGAATVLFPIEKLEPGLRSGKIVFTWKQICEGVLPRPVVAEATANLQLELPLHIIAPLFVAKRRQPRGQKVVSISDLPDLFSKTIVPLPKPPEGTVPPPVVLRAPVIEPVPVIEPALVVEPPLVVEPVPVVEPAPIELKMAVEEIPEVALPREGSPNQIIKFLVAQPGITGAFIAMQDGLLVAAQLHESLKADTVAAFLPQIFGRMNQYTKELQLGSLTSLILNVENSSWQIVKSGGMYLVAISDPGKTFSLDKLNALAVQLAVKIQ